MGRVFNFRSGCMHTMHLLPGVAIQPNFELKTRPKQLLGSLPLLVALPRYWVRIHNTRVSTLLMIGLNDLDCFSLASLFSLV
jgi:hypothetical protein